MIECIINRPREPGGFGPADRGVIRASMPGSMTRLTILVVNGPAARFEE
jgi:hypothetical protein